MSDEQELTTWPWESRLYGEGDVAASAEPTAVVVPGNVNCLIKQEEFLEDVFGSDFEEGEERYGC